MAAINISVPGARVSRQELDTRLAPMVRQAAWDISRALGADAGPGGPANDLSSRLAPNPAGGKFLGGRVKSRLVFGCPAPLVNGS